MIDKEFDDSSSSSSSDDDHHHHHHRHNPEKVPLKKKIRSVQALKTILDEDYDNYIKTNAVSINNKFSTVVKHNPSEDNDLSFEEKRSDEGTTERQMEDDPFFQESVASPQEKSKKNREDPSEPTEQEYEVYVQKSSSDSEEFEMDIEFSKSFQELMSPTLKNTLMNIYRLRHTLKRQMDKCKDDVQKDIDKFDKSVKRQVTSGSISMFAAGITIKNTKVSVRTELETLQV